MDEAGDVVVEAVGVRTDVVPASLTYAPGANLGNLVLTSTRAIGARATWAADLIMITGNAAQNEIWSGEGADTLDGGAGADLLRGDLGSDIHVADDSRRGDRSGAAADDLTGGPGANAFVFRPPVHGTDVVADFASGADRLWISCGGVFGGALAEGALDPLRLTYGSATSGDRSGTSGNGSGSGRWPN